MSNKRAAWPSLRESLHDFRLYEWAPFGWILLVQVLFLVAALNLGTVWGMATAGGVARLVGRGGAIVHYPTVFVYLPMLASLVEWFLYVVPGSVLIPLALLRIAAPMETAPETDRSARLRKAILPTLVAGAMNLAVLQLWQWAGNRFPAPQLRASVPGAGDLLAWLLGVLVSYAISAVLLYVPIHAIRRGVSFRAALAGGVAEGVRLILPTLLVIVLCSWPALLCFAPAYLGAETIVARMRPELTAVFLLGYCVLASFANYLIYASASRLHWASAESRR